METRTRIYVNGDWTAPGASDVIEIFDSTDGAELGTIVPGTRSDVDKAVAAARAAFPTWAARTAEERAKACARISEGLAARQDEIAALVTREVGTPRKISVGLQAGLAIGSFRNAAEIAMTYDYEEKVANSVIVHEPVGVVGCITPWNYPLHQIAAKVAYALA